MWTSIKKLGLSLLLIVLASAVLLYSDKSQKKHRNDESTPGSSSIPKVAVLQMSSSGVIEDAAHGAFEALKNEGLVDKQTMMVTRYNAEGDTGTQAQMALAIAQGDFDLVFTLSTPSLQAMANANKNAKKPHVFCGVTDPWEAGVEIKKNPPSQPAYMTGYGTMQPVKEVFESARKFNPGLKKIGVCWNPAEKNSEINVMKARTATRDMDLELLEANASNGSEVGTACRSLLARGVDVIWVGGDVNAMTAIDTIVGVAKLDNIPVISNLPGLEKHGVLFCYGANYVQVGYDAGELAAKVLKGASPSTLPVVEHVPAIVTFNTSLLPTYRDKWTIPAADLEKAMVVYTDKGVTDRRPKLQAIVTEAIKKSDFIASTQPGAVAARRTQPKALSRTWQIYMISSADSPANDASVRGIKDGLVNAGLIEGRDYVIHHSNAQLDSGTLNSLVQQARSEHADMVIPVCTPATQVAIRAMAKDQVPIVFCTVADPVKAGAGKSLDDHLPYVTGVSSRSAVVEAAALLRRIFPTVKKVGTVYCPSEVNSVYYRDMWAIEMGKADIELLTRPAEHTIDLPGAVNSLTQENVQVLTQIADNLGDSGFPMIVQAARDAKTPIFCFTSSGVRAGALAAVARDYYEIGFQAAGLADRVMRGEPIERIPILATGKTQVILNLKTARDLGIDIPADVVAKANEVIR